MGSPIWFQIDWVQEMKRIQKENIEIASKLLAQDKIIESAINEAKKLIEANRGRCSGN